MKNWEERLFISKSAAARFLKVGETTISGSIKFHYLIGGSYLAMLQNAILTPAEIMNAIASKKKKSLLVTVIETGEKKVFASYKEAAAFMGCNGDTITQALKRTPSIIKNIYIIHKN